ncbi:MAG: hypothetical protein IJC17_02320 [Clostridia bacterium]|nr:hypothetical protein [Clostridia bacterium]
MANASHSRLRELAFLAVFTALMIAGKEAMAFLPNIEPVTLLVILLTCHFGWKALWSVFAFVLLEGFLYGFSTWVLQYLYLWPLLVVIVMLLRRWSHPVLWTVVAGIYGWLFGPLSSLPYMLTRGMGGFWASIVAGFSFDMLHLVGNVVIVGLCFWPLDKLMKRLIPKLYQ